MECMAFTTRQNQSHQLEREEGKEEGACQFVPCGEAFSSSDLGDERGKEGRMGGGKEGRERPRVRE